MTDLGTRTGSDLPSDINNSGQIVGGSSFAGSGFLLDGDTLIDLPTLGGNDGAARAINDSSQIAGASNLAGNQSYHAFLWENDSITDLGALGRTFSAAWGINNDGQIVGHAWNTWAVDTIAFLWEEGVMADLNDLVSPSSDWVLQSAHDINNIGQIVGYGINPDGERHGFLLTPIPEPATVTILALGSLALLRRRRG